MEQQTNASLYKAVENLDPAIIEDIETLSDIKFLLLMLGFPAF